MPSATRPPSTCRHTTKFRACSSTHTDTGTLEHSPCKYTLYKTFFYIFLHNLQSTSSQLTLPACCLLCIPWYEMSLCGYSVWTSTDSLSHFRWTSLLSHPAEHSSTVRIVDIQSRIHPFKPQSTSHQSQFPIFPINHLTHHPSIIWIRNRLPVIKTSPQTDRRRRVCWAHALEVAQVRLVGGQDVRERTEVLGGDLPGFVVYGDPVLIVIKCVGGVSSLSQGLNQRVRLRKAYLLAGSHSPVVNSAK